MRKKYKTAGRILMLLIVAAALCLSASREMGRRAKAVAPDYVFTYAENQPYDYPTTQGARKFADLVYARTENRIKINVYCDGEAGDETAVLEQLRYGGIDFARVSVMSMGDTFPELNILQLPYLFESREHMWAVLDGEVGRTLMSSLSGSDYVGLSWYDAGARNFYTVDAPITCLEDLSGLKIRVADSQLMSDMVRALGAVPYTISYGEVYAALERGSIDGAENNWPSYQSALHYEVAPYFTLDTHNRIPEIQLCARSTWEQLSESDQAILLDCARESAVYERVLWNRREKQAQKDLVDAGCTVTELPQAEIARFREATLPLYEKYAADYMGLIAEIQAAGKSGA